MKKSIEKVRDDLYVKKGLGGTYTVVYPMKDNEDKPIKGNLKKALLSDIIPSLYWLFTIGILLMMLLPGAQNIKEQCEDNIQYLYENACDYCSEQRYGGNLEIPIEMEIGGIESDG